MTQYSRNMRTSVTSSGAAVVELIAGANKGCRVKEIGIIIVNGTASTFGLGRPAAKGITPTTPVSLLSPLELTAPTDAKLAVAWGTPPTQPAALFRQCALPATAGASLNPTWKFDQGIWVPANGTLILWSGSTVSVADIFFVIEE